MFNEHKEYTEKKQRNNINIIAITLILLSFFPCEPYTSYIWKKNIIPMLSLLKQINILNNNSNVK